MTTYTATPATMHSGHDIRDAKGSMVAIVHSPAADPAKGAKIAALMAAAPEMLAALQGAIETADGTAGMSEAWWYAPARVAITRATAAVIKKTEFDEVRVADHPTEAVDLDHDLDEIDAAEYLAAIARATGAAQ